MSLNQNSGYGRALLDAVASQVPAFGRILVVMSSSDSTDYNYDRMQEVFKVDPSGQVAFFTSLETAYAAAQTNNNDVIVLDGHSTHSVADGIAWSKSRVHLMGFDGGDRLIDQGAKVQLSGNVATAYVLKVTGTRNSFRNIKFIQASTNAAALNVLQMGGEGNLYKNVSAIFGVNNNLGSTSAAEVVCGEDSGTFINCTFGSDTLLTTAARAVFVVKQVTTSQEFKSNQFKDCTFIISSSSGDAYLLKVNSTADVLFTNLFRNCVFQASVDSAGGIALTNAVTSASGLVKGTLNFYLPGSFNCTNFSANDSSNFKVFAPAASNNAFEAVQPA